MIWDPQAYVLRMFGFDEPLSKQPLQLPFPGALGVEVQTGRLANPIAQMYNQLLQFEEERALLYTLYDEMELDPTIYSYLEQLSEDATQRDSRQGVIVWAEAQSPEVEKMANEMLHETGLADDLPQPLIRHAAKYGDWWEFIVAEQGKGVTRLIPYHPATITRVHDEYGRLKGFTPYQTEDASYWGGQAYKVKDEQLLTKPWDFLHFRRMGRSHGRVYGTSVLYGARRIWRQVQMMEDKLALMRLLRLPNRYKYKVDVTGMGVIDGDRKMEKMRQSVKRDFRFDSNQRDFASVYNLLSEHEDLFIQTRKDDQTDVEVLSGVQGLDDIRDFEMFLNRMFGALRAPPAYFGFEGTANYERSPSQQDLRFARQAAGMQRVFLGETARLIMLHMIYKGVDPYTEENQFTLNMVPPSSLEELYRLEVMEARIRALDSMARIGTTVNIDSATWMQVILSELGVFSRSFTTTVLGAIRDLEKKGVPPEDVAQEALKSPVVQKALNEQREGKDVPWQVHSKIIRLPNDLKDLIKADERTAADKAGEAEKLMEMWQKTHKDGKRKAG